MSKVSVRVLIAALMVAVLLALAGPAFAQEADEWSQFQKDKANSGCMDCKVPESGRASEVTKAIDARDGSQPVVSGSNLFVYTGVDDTSGSVICYDMTDWEKVWETDIEPPMLGSWSSPAVSGGVVFIGSGSKVYAIDALNGSKKWVRDLGDSSAVVNGSPTVDGDRVLIGDWSPANEGRYLCLDAGNGKLLWEHKLESGCHAQSTPAVDGDRVYVGQMSATFGTGRGKVWCLNRQDGKTVNSWGNNGYFRTVDDQDVTGSVAIEGDFLYFSDFSFGAADEPNSHIYCLDKAGGDLVWKAPVFPSSGTPAVGDGKVVTASNQWGVWPAPSTNWITAFRAGKGGGGAAKQLWNRKDIGGFNMSSCLAGDRVLCGNWDANTWKSQGVYCLDAGTGSTVWGNKQAGGSSPVPTRYGVVSIGGGKVAVCGANVASLAQKGEFYFAEGTTRAGYQEWLCFENASSKSITANIDYMLSDGTTRRQPVSLPGSSRTTVDVNSFLGQGCDAAVHVTGTGPFVAERSMYVDVNGISGGEQVMGATGPGRDFLFAEGTTRDGYQTWLALQNPGTKEVDAVVTYFYSGSEPKAELVRIPPTSRKTVDVNADAGPDRDVSVAVNANGEVVAERVMYFKGIAPILGASPTGVHNSVGARKAGKEWYFAEGTTRPNFREWLCLMNPGGQATVANVSYFTGDGEVVTRQKDLPANSRTTVDVGADLGKPTDVSVSVTSEKPLVAERPMYFEYAPSTGGATQPWGGGHNSIGTSYGAYKWEFAEGTTRPGYETYLCIANTNDRDVVVAVDYIINKDGAFRKKEKKVTVKKNSRYTIQVKDEVEPGCDVSFELTSGVPVIVERPMYFGAGPYAGGGTTLGYCEEF